MSSLRVIATTPGNNEVSRLCEAVKLSKQSSTTVQQSKSSLNMSSLRVIATTPGNNEVSRLCEAVKLSKQSSTTVQQSKSSLVGYASS